MFHYVNTLKQELDDTRAYQEMDTDDTVVNAHTNCLLSFLFVSLKAETNFFCYLIFIMSSNRIEQLHA